MVYENLAPTIAPIAGLLGSFAPDRLLKGLSTMKPTLIAAYGEPDRLTVSTGSNVFSGSLTNLMTGNLTGIIGQAVPLPQFAGQRRRP